MTFMQLLSGDIGGTKTVLRLAAAPAVPGGDPAQPLEPLAERTFASADFPDLAPIVRRFLEGAGRELGRAPAPRAACFAVAGPVEDGSSRITNLPWVLREERLARELEVPRVRLINDFAAVGHAIPALGPDAVRTLQPGQPDPATPIAVIGAGTGLGEGFLVPRASGYTVFATEGGHADFAPRSLLEFELLHYLREAHGIDRVSVERVVSGPGIAAVYEFLRSRNRAAESAEMAGVFSAWKREIGRRDKSIDLAAEVSRRARGSGDPLCGATMDLFIAAYGAEAGNLALKLLPYGGLYVAGGIATKNLPLFEGGAFIEAFRAKGRFRPLMERIPVHVIVDPRVGLLGAARRAQELAREEERR